MARTLIAPWDFRQAPPTLAQLQEDNIFIEYCMILNRLERDYGIDRIGEIAKPWRKLETAKKLELVKQLEVELDTKAENKEAERHDWVSDPKHFKTRGC